MSYRRFKPREIEIEPATLATTATVWPPIGENVASVADVADPEPESAVETVADVAVVARLPRENEDRLDLIEERAAILEYDEGLTRDEAERLAAEQIQAASVSGDEVCPTVGHIDDAGADKFPTVGNSSDARSGKSNTVSDFAASIGSRLRPSDWLPPPGPGITILHPAVEVSADEYDRHLDTLIAALPAGSAEAQRLAFAKRKGWVVDRGSERIFTRGRK